MYYNTDMDILNIKYVTKGLLVAVGIIFIWRGVWILLDLIDKSATVMGSRMLKKWLMRPLIDLTAILNRQKAITVLVQDLMRSVRRNQATWHLASLFE